MKQADMNRVLEKAMVDFREAHYRLLATIERYEMDPTASVNDLTGFTEDYPFDKSLDELPIAQWVDSVVAGLQPHNYTILNYEYMNTGGNCMVGIHEVWLPEEHKTVYVYTNEEGCTMVAVDYIRNELVVDDYDDVTIDYCDFGRLTGHEKYFELYRYCLNQYTKDDCRYFNMRRSIPYHLLSDDLQKQLDADYLRWLEYEGIDSIYTDGYKVFVNERYEDATDIDKLMEAVKEFKRWHDTIAGDDKYYECNYRLTIGDRELEVPFMASAWSGVDELLRTIIDQM